MTLFSTVLSGIVGAHALKMNNKSPIQEFEKKHYSEITLGSVTKRIRKLQLSAQKEHKLTTKLLNIAVKKIENDFRELEDKITTAVAYMDEEEDSIPVFFSLAEYIKTWNEHSLCLSNMQKTFPARVVKLRAVKKNVDDAVDRIAKAKVAGKHKMHKIFQRGKLQHTLKFTKRWNGIKNGLAQISGKKSKVPIKNLQFAKKCFYEGNFAVPKISQKVLLRNIIKGSTRTKNKLKADRNKNVKKETPIIQNATSGENSHSTFWHLKKNINPKTPRELFETFLANVQERNKDSEWYGPEDVLQRKTMLMALIDQSQGSENKKVAKREEKKKEEAQSEKVAKQELENKKDEALRKECLAILMEHKKTWIEYKKYQETLKASKQIRKEQEAKMTNIRKFVAKFM